MPECCLRGCSCLADGVSIHLRITCTTKQAGIGSSAISAIYGHRLPLSPYKLTWTTSRSESPHDEQMRLFLSSTEARRTPQVMTSGEHPWRSPSSSTPLLYTLTRPQSSTSGVCSSPTATSTGLCRTPSVVLMTRRALTTTKWAQRCCN